MFARALCEGAGRPHSLENSLVFLFLSPAAYLQRLRSAVNDPLDNHLKFFNPWEEIDKSRNHLPHWQQPGATYFITFRLADSVPATLRAEINEQKAAWLQHKPANRADWDDATLTEYHKRFSGAIEQWLDAGHGSCFLRKAEARAVVSRALLHFDSDRYWLLSAVVMPNHVNALLSLRPEGAHPLQGVLHSWKSFTAHEISKSFSSCPKPPKPFWQEDYFDRLVRDGEHLRNCIRYIRRNPEKAKLPVRDYDLYESALAKAVE